MPYLSYKTPEGVLSVTPETRQIYLLWFFFFWGGGADQATS